MQALWCWSKGNTSLTQKKCGWIKYQYTVKWISLWTLKIFCWTCSHLLSHHIFLRNPLSPFVFPSCAHLDLFCSDTAGKYSLPVVKRGAVIKFDFQVFSQNAKLCLFTEGFLNFSARLIFCHFSDLVSSNQIWRGPVWNYPGVQCELILGWKV